MFERVLLVDPTERSIVLQTHRGNNIINSIAAPPSPRHVAIYREILAKHPDWLERRPPAGVFNCVGHTWANRRTAVYEDLDHQVQMIYDDDGYRVVRPDEPVQPGDLATYWESLNPRAGFLHVGLVVRIQVGSGFTFVFVLSKWNDTSGEVFHECRDVQFYEGARFGIEFWTDRPGRPAA